MELTMNRNELIKCIEQLNANEQQVMTLRLSGYRIAEIARQLNYSPQHVETIIKNCIAHLQNTHLPMLQEA